MFASGIPSGSAAKGLASADHNPHQNRLLNALPKLDCDRIASHLELIPMPLGEVPHEPGIKRVSARP